MCFKRKLKEINPNLNISSKEIVVYQKFKKDRIYLGIPVKIPRNFVLVICSGTKVLDTLYEGQTDINLHVLPNTTRILELYELDKKGKSPKYFIGDAYFVNLNKFEGFKWQTLEYAELEDKDYGAYKASCLGELNFKIFDPVKFLNYMLKEVNLKEEQLVANNVLQNFINERILNILNKLNPLAEDLYLKKEEIIKTIYDKLGDVLKEIGITLDGISLTETMFPPKILDSLKNTTNQPIGIRGWGNVSFEEWQVSNPSNNTPKKPKFVTVVPTESGYPFFKESIPPYFFEGIEEEQEKKQTVEEIQPVWKGIDEKTTEENSKKLVDLDDNDDDNKN